MLKDDNIMNVYYKFYICQLKAATPYSEFLPKIKDELKQLGEEVFNIKDSSTPQKQKSSLNNNNIIQTQSKNDELGRNLNYLAQTINQYENIDFESKIDDNYMKHIIVYENKFYSKVNILGIIYGFDVSSRNNDNKRYILRIDDGTGRIMVTFWDNSKYGKKTNNYVNDLEKVVKSGVKINIFGKITFFNGNIQITGEKFLIVNNYYIENLFNEILIQEQQVLANIQKNNKSQISNSDTNNLLKKIKEKYYTPYNIKLEKNNLYNDNDNDNENNINNLNENYSNKCHTKLILKIKNNMNSNNEDNNNTNQNNKNNIDPTFEYNVRKFANYLLLVLDEKDLIESNNLKYIIDDDDIIKEEENKNQNLNKNEKNSEDNNNEMDIENVENVFKKEEKKNEENNDVNIEEKNKEDINLEKDKLINDILEDENLIENEIKEEKEDIEENKDIDLDEFLNCLTEEEKPFNLDDENIPRGVNPTPIKDAKYLRVKLKYLLTDLRIYGLMKHYIPSIDENDPKTIIPVFKIVINKFEQNMIGKNITKEKDENYLENEVEFDVRFIDKLKEQIRNIIKKKNGEKIDFYDIKHIISSKYNQLLLDKIIKLLLQSLINSGEIYMEDKHAYKYLLY